MVLCALCVPKYLNQKRIRHENNGTKPNFIFTFKSILLWTKPNQRLIDLNWFMVNLERTKALSVIFFYQFLFFGLFVVHAYIIITHVTPTWRERDWANREARKQMKWLRHSLKKIIHNRIFGGNQNSQIISYDMQMFETFHVCPHYLI